MQVGWRPGALLRTCAPNGVRCAPSLALAFSSHVLFSAGLCFDHALHLLSSTCSCAHDICVIPRSELWRSRVRQLGTWNISGIGGGNETRDDGAEWS